MSDVTEGRNITLLERIVTGNPFRFKNEIYIRMEGGDQYQIKCFCPRKGSVECLQHNEGIEPLCEITIRAS